jgi:hypothetical protein
MDQQPQQVKGNFTANMIKAGESRYGKRRPNVRGFISVPGTERLQPVSLWTNEYADKQTGEMLMGMNGNVDGVSRSDSAMDQLRAHARGASGPTILVDRIKGKEPIELEDGKIVIFQSKHKDGQQKAANGNLRSDFYGYWNNSGQLVEIGVWLHKKNDLSQAFLGGATQFPLPGKEATQPDFGTMSHDDLDRMERDHVAMDAGHDASVDFAGDFESESEAKKGKRSGRGR